MEWKKIIGKFEGIKILHQKFKQPEINYPQIKPAHDINEDILNQLKQNNVQQTEIIVKQHRTNIKLWIASLFFAALSILVGFLHFYHTNNYSKLFQEIQILQEQSQDNTSMLLQQSMVLDSLHYQVRTLEQSLQKDSLR